MAGNRRRVLLFVGISASLLLALLSVLSASIPEKPARADGAYPPALAVAYSQAYSAALPPPGQSGHLDARLLEGAIAANRELGGHLDPGFPGADEIRNLLKHQRGLLAWHLEHGIRTSGADELALTSFGTAEEELKGSMEASLDAAKTLLQETRTDARNATIYRVRGVGSTPGWLQLEAHAQALLEEAARQEAIFSEIVQPHSTWFRAPAAPGAWGPELEESLARMGQDEVVSLAALEPGVLALLDRASSVDAVGWWLAEAASRTNGARGAEIHLEFDGIVICATARTAAGPLRYCPEGAGDAVRVVQVQELGSQSRVGLGTYETKEGQLAWYVRNAERDDLTDVQLLLGLPSGAQQEVGRLQQVASLSTATLAFADADYEGPAVLTLVSQGQVIQEVEGFMAPGIGWLR